MARSGRGASNTVAAPARLLNPAAQSRTVPAVVAPASASPPAEAPRAPPLGKRIKRTLRFHAVKALLALVQLLPLRAALAIGRFLGGLAYHVFGRDRGLALSHLAKAFPHAGPEEHARIAKAMFRHFGMLGAEVALIGKIDPATYVEVPPEAHAVLEGALTGNGAIAVTGHIGNWELLFRRFVHAGWRAYAVGKEQPDPRMTAIIEGIRGEGRTIWRGAEGSTRKLLRAFRENALLAMLIDQDTKVQGVFVPFFGELAFTPRAAADLALRTGAPVVAVFVHRKPEGGHRVTARRVDFTPTGDAEADAVALTAAMTAEIEGHVRAVPHEWVWMHRRWKTRP